MLFSCPRRVEALGSTAFPVFGWGVHRQELAHSGAVISLVRNDVLHASCSLHVRVYYLWCWYNSMVYVLPCARALSARSMLFMCPRMVESLGLCWYIMGMVWYAAWYGVAWCAVGHGV